MGHGQKRQPRNEMQALTRREPVRTPSKERRARGPRGVRRGGLAASEACRNRALQGRHKSGAQAADAELNSRDAAKQFPRWKRACCRRKSRLAVEAVNMKAEDERLQAKLARRAARQHRAWEER